MGHSAAQVGQMSVVQMALQIAFVRAETWLFSALLKEYLISLPLSVVLLV
jgi:hypothetical protein